VKPFQQSFLLGNSTGLWHLCQDKVNLNNYFILLIRGERIMELRHLSTFQMIVRREVSCGQQKN